MLKDIRLGVRNLVKHPGFTIIAVITLAVGIGATSTIFSVINGLILTPPNMVEADRIVAVSKTSSGSHVQGFVSYPDLQDWRQKNQSLEDIAGYKPTNFMLSDRGESERLAGLEVTANFLPLLRISPHRGRNFQPNEEQRGTELVTILSYEVWQTRFGSDEGIIGKPVSLNGKSHTVIGVLPPRFEFPLSDRDVEVMTSTSVEGENLVNRGAYVFLAFARLKRDVSIEQAQAELHTLASSLAQEYPGEYRDRTIALLSARDQIVGTTVRQALWLLLGAVGFILLIACMNAASLQLIRATAKQKEIAIRVALGAGRWRIARHVLIEGALLSILACGVGLFIAGWGLQVIRYFGENQLPRIAEVRIDMRVVLFTVAASIITAIIVSVIPVLKMTHPDVNEILKAGTRGAGSGGNLGTWRNALVIIEVALSLVLMVGAGLMIRSLNQLLNVPTGFDANNLLYGSISLTSKKYDEPAQRLQYVTQTIGNLQSVPGVESAAFIAPLPFSGADVGGDFRIEGRPAPEPGKEPTATFRTVTNNYFQMMKIPITKGRPFNASDTRGAVGAAIINQRLAQIFFPNEEPLGQYITEVNANQNVGDPKRWQIVGVSSDIRHNSLTRSVRPELYFPYQQNSWPWGHFVARTTVPPATLTETFRQQIKSGDKSVAVFNVRPVDQAISATVRQPRFYTFLFTLFGAVALVLTITGIYGVVSYAVVQRTQEIGIRMALGAQASNVFKLIIGEGFVLTFIGVVLGLIAAFALTRFMRGLLFGVGPTDPLTFVALPVLSLAVALVACYLPARRATKVDPLVALRYE